MSQEPEKKETKNPADRFNKVNRKMTIVWTGVAVLVVLAIALVLGWKALPVILRQRKKKR